MIWQTLIIIITICIISGLLSVAIVELDYKHEMRKKKKIHIYYVNKIKYLDYKIYEQEDNDYPNYIVVKSCERWKRHWLYKANIMDENLRNELLSICLWHCDDIEARLEANGWQILRGKENL